MLRSRCSRFSSLRSSRRSPLRSSDELQQILQRYKSLDAALLQTCVQTIPAPNEDAALIAMGRLTQKPATDPAALSPRKGINNTTSTENYLQTRA